MTYVIALADLEAFYDEPGEYGWILEAYRHGFEQLSLIITDTLPGGGPPLHQHTCDEAVVVPAGAHMRYLIDAQAMEVAGAAVVRIPAGAVHAFVNAGTERVTLVCIFDDRGFWDSYRELGPSPLIDADR